MVRSVIISRIHDGLPLAASMDDDDLENEYPGYKAEAKTIMRNLASQTEPRFSIEAKSFIFQYSHLIAVDIQSPSFLSDNGVGFLCICDKLYPKRLAFSFLEDLQREFMIEFGDRIETATRPYAFVKFDTYIQKAKRSYKDVRATQNLERLRGELVDVTGVMTKSIRDVLERGEKLETLGLISRQLTEDSRRYAGAARQLNLQFLYRKYGPPCIVAFIVILFLYIWLKWF